MTLSDPEREALVRVQKRLIIDHNVRATLIAKGLVKTLLGGDALTTKAEDILAKRRLR